MNGLYSETVQEPEVGGKAFNWTPGAGYTSGSPSSSARVIAAAEQRKTLDDLAKYTDTMNRLDSAVYAAENYADAIETAYTELQDAIAENPLWLAGVPDWWSEEVRIQRGLRVALIQSVRETANRIAETYGLR